MELIFELSVWDVILLLLFPVLVILYIAQYVREVRESRKTLGFSHCLVAEFESLRQKAKQRETK